MHDGLLMALRTAGVVQLLIVLTNVPAARILETGRHLRDVPAIFRQVTWAHTGWVVATAVLLAGLDLVFAEDLLGGSALATYLLVWLALLWTARLVLQAFVYDRQFRRRHAAADLALLVAYASLAVVHAVAASVHFGA